MTAWPVRGGLDADLGDDLAAGRLGEPPVDLAAFEAAFTAMVESAHPDRDRAWDLFYDATLARVNDAWSDPGRDQTRARLRHGGDVHAHLAPGHGSRER